MIRTAITVLDLSILEAFIPVQAALRVEVDSTAAACRVLGSAAAAGTSGKGCGPRRAAEDGRLHQWPGAQMSRARPCACPRSSEQSALQSHDRGVGAVVNA